MRLQTLQRRSSVPGFPCAGAAVTYHAPHLCSVFAIGRDSSVLQREHCRLSSPSAKQLGFVHSFHAPQLWPRALISRISLALQTEQTRPSLPTSVQVAGFQRDQALHL